MELPALTPGQYNLVYNGFSLAIACMGAGFIFFVLARQSVGEKYRGALLVSGLVVAIAAYHYFRIFESFSGAYALDGGVYVPTGEAFNDAYRYIDWLLTVPLLLVEAIAVLGLPRGKSGSLIARLAAAAVAMIALGYPGEVADNNTTRFIWGTLSTIPFVYILWILWSELGDAMGDQPEQVQKLVRNLRLLLLGTWGVYPLAYMAPFFGFSGAAAFVTIQVGYTIADILAKPGFGLLIYGIAREKTRADAAAGATGTAGAAAAATD